MAASAAVVPVVTAFVLMMGFAFGVRNAHGGELVSVRSRDDGESYLVRPLPDRIDAADMLARLRRRILQLLDHLEEEKQREDSFCRGSIEQLRTRFRPDRISESPPTSEHTSYSVNKGEHLFFCLRPQRSADRLIDDNTLMFVALHELSHIMTRSIGHTPEFWSNFRYLLRVAIRHGIYTYVDYQANPKGYCGIEITDSPYRLLTDGSEAEPDSGPNDTQSCR
jgi:hypothetical protein